MEDPWRRNLCVFFTLLLTFSTYTPTHADAVCKACNGAGGPFAEGQVYTYQLEGSTVTNLPGSPNEVTSLKVTATAQVSSESKCQNVLKLSDVKVSGPDGKVYDGLAADCAKPVKFAYNEGKLLELCGKEDDRGTALNIKRAVISLLSSIKRKEGGSDTAYEHDVFGICPTDFTFNREGTALKIRKTKNLNRCALREEFTFPFPSTTYQASQSSFGSFETSPLLGAQLTVDQTLENGVLQKATGEEVYNYRPLVSPDTGATVKVTYTLTLKSAAAGAIPADGSTPKGVYYEAAHDDDGVKNQAAISEALQKAVTNIEPVATPEAAKTFAHLVYVIEQGSKADILQAYNAASGKISKNLFLDGLFYAGSADSVEAAAELLSSKQIPEGSALRWYLDLNFVKHASRGSLKSLLPLLSGDKVPHQAYIGIGAVAGKFCLEHRGLCESSPEFKALQDALAAPLSGGCKVDSHDKENTIIASLKGLRNTRHLSDEVAQKISKCALDKSAKSRVRVAAIEAFHAEPSKPVLKEAATNILKDVEEDSELRIKGFLSLVECPCNKVADTIKDLLDNEPVNQVGNFIVSYLRNLRTSISPEKEAAKHVFGNIVPKKKFEFDQRKYSRNYELSYSLDALNIGTVVEHNKIFSQKSFIPRSLAFNVTTQLFGHSVNLAEIGLRAENLEWHLERLFGPKGLLVTKGAKVLDELAETAEEKLKKAKEQVEKSRAKREVNKQEADAAADKVKLGPDYEDRFTDLDLSVKLFGSDIGWLNYHYEKVNYNALKQKLNKKLDETLDHSKSLDIDYKKARKILDLGMTYPTGLGFALKVKVDGSSAVNFKMNGKLDVKAILNHPQNSHIAFQFVPSANIELASVLSVDAHVVEAGVKVAANLHSSTGTDLTIKVLDGYGIDVKLGLPVKKQEILNFSADVVSIVRENKGSEVESPIKFNGKRHDSGGCFDQLSALTGLTFCGEVSVPLDGLRVLNPAYGPSKASLRLEKDDESLTAYHFKAFYNNKQPDQMSVEVLLDTPNSKTNRKFALTAEGSLKPKKHLLITLTSPFKTATLEGLVIDTDSEQAVSAKLVSDGAEWSVKAGAHVSGDENRKKYEPLLEYKYPESGKSERAWIGRKGAANKGSQRQQSALGVTGAVFVEKNPTTPYRKYELKGVTLTTPRVKVTVDGTITIDSNLVATDLKASYDKETVVLNSKIQKLDTKKYIAKIELTPSQYPDFGGSIKWEFEKQPDKIENKLVVVHGPDLKSDTSRVSIAQLLKYKFDSVRAYDLLTENTVSYPLLGISAAVKGGVTPKTINYDVDVTYDKTNVKSKLDAKIGMKHRSDFVVDFEAKALGNSVDFKSKHERVTSSRSILTNTLEIQPGGKYQLNSIAEFYNRPNDLYQLLDAEVKFPQEPKIFKVKCETKLNNKEKDFEFEVTAGNKRFVDLEVEVQKKPEVKGKYKLAIFKILESEGTFETKDGKSTGKFNLEVVKTGRKITGEGEVTKKGDHVKGAATVLWDANKDPSKKLKLETDTTYQARKSIDSKNTIQVADKTLKANVKGDLDGVWTDGKLNGEAEVVLPCGRSIKGKVNRELHLTPEDNKVEGVWELWDTEAGAEPRKLVLKLAGKNINLAKIQFDGQADVSYLAPSKDDITLHLVGKKIPQADKWAISGQGSLGGSLVKRPLEVKLNGEVAEQLLRGQLTPDRKLPPANYEFELKAGGDISVVASGKVNGDQANNEVELKLPADLQITQIKWKTANTINLNVAGGSNLKLVTDNDVHWNGNKFAKLRLDGEQGKNEQSGTIVWETDKLPQRTLTYKANINEARNGGNLDLGLKWEGKVADLGLKLAPLHLHLTSNVPEHGKYEIDASYKRSDDGADKDTIVTVLANDKKMVYRALFSRRLPAPFVDVTMELPDGKFRTYLKLDKKGEHHALVEGQLVWFTNGGGQLDASGEVNIHTIQDFLVKLNLNSPKLNWNNVDFEAKANGETVSFHGKNGDKELSGTVNLASKEALPKILYEGKGELKVGGTTYPLDFILKNEVTSGVKYETEVGWKAGVYEFNTHTVWLKNASPLRSYKMDHVTKYCCDKGCKQNVVKMTSDKKENGYELNTDIKIEGVFMKLEHPLILRDVYKRVGWQQYDSLVEISYGADTIKNHAYIKDAQAGWELTLPKRVIATEVVYELPELTKEKKPLSFKLEASFWLDKKSINDKSTILLTSQNTRLPDGFQSSSEAKVSSPGLKELSVKGDLNVNIKDRIVKAKLIADVFAQKNQKLIADYQAVGKKEKDAYTGNIVLHIFSKGLQVETKVERKFALSKTSYSESVVGYYTDSKQAKREAVAKLSVDLKSLSALVKIPEATLFAAEYTLHKGDKLFHKKGKFEILGVKFEEDTELKGTLLKSTIIQKSGNNAQLDLEIGFTQGQIAEVSGKFNKKSFASLQVALDEANFLKTKPSYNTDVAKELVKQVKDTTVELVKEGSRVAKETGAKLTSEANERVEIYRKALPNFKAAADQYKKELQELKNEIANNKNIKGGLKFLENTLGVIISQISAILHEIATTSEHLVSLLNEALQKVTESVKATIPKLKESFEKASVALQKLADGVLKQVKSIINVLLDKIKEHEKEISELTSVVTDSLSEVGQLFSKTFGELQREIKEFLNVLWDQIQTLPAYTMLKEKLQELKNLQIPQQYWEGYHEVVANIVNVLPTPELQQLVKSVTDLLEKIVKHEAVDKGEVLEQLYRELVAAVRSVVAIIQGLKPEDQASLPSNFLLPIPSFSQLTLPVGTFRLNLLNLVRSPDYPTIAEMFHIYRPKHYPWELQPPFHASAQLIGGSEFITFDRKHFSFKGSCSYILSTDIIDRNFTLIANLKEGKLKSIAVLDHENSVELLDDETVLFNNQPAELPVHEGDLHLFRRYIDGTGFLGKSGLWFFCTPNLDICAFKINSFYFGKTRGLLGTYNYETYDDNMLPEGKVSKSTAEFANAWKVSGSCADGTALEQPAPQAQECTNLFTSASPLRGCFSYESPEKYRDACNKLVGEAAAERKQQVACEVAQSYVGYSRYVHFCRVSLPDYCGKCQVGSQTLKAGESVSVTAGSKQADILFVVEQQQENEEVFKSLVTPLVSTLTNELNEKGITDVHFGLLGYGASDQKYPAIYTFNGKVHGFSAPPKNIYFSKHEDITKPKLSDRLKEIKKRFLLETGYSKAGIAFRESYEYPFRPEAAKVVIGVVSSADSCERAALPLQSLRQVLGKVNVYLTGTIVHTIAPLKDLKLEGKDEKAAANVVGFDSHTVYTQSEVKKKVLKGDEEAHKSLRYTSDRCTDFTLGANGAVFSSTNFVNGKPNVRKNFLTVLSNLITNSVTGEEVKKECKCELEKGMVVRTKCRVISRTKKESKGQ